MPYQPCPKCGAKYTYLLQHVCETAAESIGSEVTDILENKAISYNPKPGEVQRPAPQSESEAVRLLREAHDLMRITDATHDWFVSADAFLSRPAGPDWRKLAVDALLDIDEAESPEAMLDAVGAIRYALAAEKGGSSEIR